MFPNPSRVWLFVFPLPLLVAMACAPKAVLSSPTKQVWDLRIARPVLCTNAVPATKDYYPGLLIDYTELGTLALHESVGEWEFQYPGRAHTVIENACEVTSAAFNPWAHRPVPPALFEPLASQAALAVLSIEAPYHCYGETVTSGPLTVNLALMHCREIFVSVRLVVVDNAGTVLWRRRADSSGYIPVISKLFRSFPIANFR